MELAVSAAISLLVLLSSSIIIWLIILRRKPSSNLPPGPYQLPIIGNILVLGSKPHQSLAKLSKKYGPIMSLRLGSITTIVVSSPEITKTMLLKHDLIVSNRKAPHAISAPEHDKFSVAWLPLDNAWRKVRKICKENMFSVSRLDSSQGLRKEKLDQLYDYVNQACQTGRAVDIGEAAFTTSLNLMSASLFSMDFATFNSESSHEMKDVVRGVMRYVGAPNFSDYFPVLKGFDPQGIATGSKFYFGKLKGIFNKIIDQRLKSNEAELKHDMVEALIAMNLKDENELTRDEINHLLVDLFVAGTDTTSATVEWAITELLRNPKKMSQLRKEINETIGKEEIIQESDISRLPYLQAVVKETFRLHPAAPFLVPRKSNADVEINGYTIPKDAQILVNVWASGRDHDIWPDADEFMPERFLNRSIDFRGNDFELIPFGAGRRICLGLPLAHRMIHLMILTLVREFEWEIKEGGLNIDMTEEFGLTLQKAVHLKVVPTKHA